MTGSFLLIWEALSRASLLNPLLIPSPSAVIESLYFSVTRGVSIAALAESAQPPSFYTNVEATLHRTIIAFAINSLIGLSAGMSFGYSKLIGEAFEPLVLLLHAFPVVVFYPAMVMAFGVGDTSKILIAVLVGLPYLVFNTATGIRAVERDLIKLGRAMGFSKLTTFWKIVVPYAAPLILQGVRLCFGFTYIGVVIAEIVFVNDGVGYLLFWYMLKFLVADLFSTIVVIMAFGGAVDLSLRWASTRMLSWKVG